MNVHRTPPAVCPYCHVIEGEQHLSFCPMNDAYGLPERNRRWIAECDRREAERDMMEAIHRDIHRVRHE